MTAMIPQAVEHDEDFYPSGDGEPMAETQIHVLAIILLFQALQDWFETRSDVFIGANNFWYWKKGDPSARRAPDVFVVPGVENKKYRRSFMSWKEGGAVPTVIFQVCSKKTWKENMHDHPPLFARLGVKEYFLFDPEDEYIGAPLLGFRLKGRKYVPLTPDSEGRLHCQQMGLFLKAEGEMLRLFDAETGEPILTRKEQTEAERQRAERQRKRVSSQRQRANREQQRAEEEAQRAEKEAQRAEKESRRAEKERQRAAALEAEVARLKALIKQANGNNANGNNPPPK